MHLFVALILTNDDSFVFSASSTSSLSSAANESHANQSTTKSPSSRKFNLHTILKEKLLEPYIQKIYGKRTNSRSECVLAPGFACAVALLLNDSQSIDISRCVVRTECAIKMGRVHLSQRISFALKGHQVQSNAQIKEVFALISIDLFILCCSLFLFVAVSLAPSLSLFRCCNCFIAVNLNCLLI